MHWNPISIKYGSYRSCPVCPNIMLVVIHELYKVCDKHDVEIQSPSRVVVRDSHHTPLVSHLYFFSTLNQERNSSYLQLSRRLNGKMLVLEFPYSKSTPIVQQKNAQNQHVERLRFSLNTNKYKYPKNCPLKIACSRPRPHLSAPPKPKFEANMNYTPQARNKSATVKFHMELILTTTTRKQSCCGATPSSTG